MPPTAALVGTQVLHYKVIDRLGEGGMGEVYLAEDTRLGRQVALKFLTDASDTDPEARARLVREAQAAALLRSPHIAVTYDLVEHGSGVFIAMEYVEGELLSARLERGPIPVAEALDVAMQVSDALDEAHGHGIVHRDIKSANLIITRRQLVKVLDFGLAKFVVAGGAADFRTVASVTLPGVVLGTITYMPPEQLLGQEVDHRADLFSLGVVLYEMLAGRLPFAGGSLAETADRILNGEPEALARFNYGVPADVEAIVRKALAKDREFRYQSARELYLDLHHARQRLPAAGLRATTMWRPGTEGLPSSSVAAPVPLPENRRHVAVLAFANITGDAADDWIGQGIAESLTADMTKVRGLGVIPREHIFDLQRGAGFGGRAADPGQSLTLGRQLGATWLVTGAYQRRGDRVRITAQVVEVASGRSVATVKLDGTIDEIFDLEDRLVEELVRKGLERELDSSERLAIASDPAASVEAFEAYSRGMLNLRLANRESVERALALFERALALQPAYVDAMVALGTALELKGAFLSLPALLRRSLELLREAVRLKPTLAEAHVRLGVTLVALGRTDEGIAALQEGLRLAPDNAGGHANLARAFWIGQGRVDDAIRHFRQALVLNPEGGYAYLQLALLHALRGDFTAAEETARQAVALQEKAMSGTQGLLVVGAHARLGYVHYLTGDYEEAIREYRRELEYLSLSDHALRERTMIEVQQKLAAAYLRSGRQEEADAYFAATTRAFDQRLAAGADDPFTRYYLAALYAQRDDVEPALHHLAAPLREIGPFTRWRLPRDPDFAPILANPLVQQALATPGDGPLSADSSTGSSEE